MNCPFCQSQCVGEEFPMDEHIINPEISVWISYEKNEINVECESCRAYCVGKIYYCPFCGRNLEV